MEHTFREGKNEWVSVYRFAEMNDVTFRTVLNWVKTGRPIKGQGKLILKTKKIGQHTFVKTM